MLNYAHKLYAVGIYFLMFSTTGLASCNISCRLLGNNKWNREEFNWNAREHALHAFLGRSQRNNNYKALSMVLGHGECKITMTHLQNSASFWSLTQHPCTHSDSKAECWTQTVLWFFFLAHNSFLLYVWGMCLYLIDPNQETLGGGSRGHELNHYPNGLALPFCDFYAKPYRILDDNT